MDLKVVHDDAKLDKLVGKFGRLLEGVRHLKQLRREVYRSVDGLKRSWFGWVSTQEAKLAKA